MRVTIIADDSKVGVDGVFRTVDLSTLDPNIHAVQWDSIATVGHIEFKDGSPNQAITSIFAFQSFIDAWTAAAPPPPTLAELKSIKKAGFATEGVTRIAAQVPEWDTIAIVAYTVSISNLLNLGNMTPAQVLAKDIYLYVKNTVPPKIAAVIDQAALDVIDPTAADPFGDGTPWPT